MRKPRYMPLIGGEHAEEEALAFVRKHGLIVIDTEGEVNVPCCPVTGEEPDRTFPLRSPRRHFDHPVSREGARRLQFERRQWIFLNAASIVVPFLYVFAVLLHEVRETGAGPWWVHFILATALLLIARRAFPKLFPRTVAAVDSPLPKGIVLLRYKDPDYAAHLYELNRKPAAPSPPASG